MIREMKDKKQNNEWAVQVMDKLLLCTYSFHEPNDGMMPASLPPDSNSYEVYALLNGVARNGSEKKEVVVRNEIRKNSHPNAKGNPPSSRVLSDFIVYFFCPKRVGRFSFPFLQFFFLYYLFL